MKYVHVLNASTMKKPEGWLKEPNFKRNGQKKALYSPIGSKGVKNREKQKKIGLKQPEGWLKFLNNETNETKILK
jgi:hypothetical protein